MPEKNHKGNSWPLLLILLVIIFGQPYWYTLCFNLVFIGYNLFGDMRLATVFFAVLLRLIFYPLRLIGRGMQRQSKHAEAESQRIAKIEDSQQRKQQQRSLLHTYRPVITFMWFDFCFFAMNAFTIHKVFITHMSPEIVIPKLFPFVGEPSFPLITTSHIPFVGMVDLTAPSPLLDAYATAGAALVGLVEIIVHKKYDKRSLLMYLILYPAVAFNMNWFVKGGFVWTLLCFEILTIATIVGEKIIGSIMGKNRKTVTA